jgi:hypothetical protein
MLGSLCPLQPLRNAIQESACSKLLSAQIKELAVLIVAGESLMDIDKVNRG